MITGTPQSMSEAMSNGPQTTDVHAISHDSPSQGAKTADAETVVQSPAGQDKSVTYIPKTRNVDTYGGVDLKYFDKYEIRPMLPTINELGKCTSGHSK